MRVNLLNKLYSRTEIIYKQFKYRNILLNNRKFESLHKGKRCFIIGNGSSLENQDLSPLRNEITFVMSAFWKHPIISEKWQPKYYCFADPLFFDGSKPMQNFFKSLKQKVKDSIFFVPLYGKEIIEKQNLLPVDNVHYILFCESLAKTNQKTIDLCKIVPSVENTAQLAIEIAIYMGCSSIYLLGLDHDWLSHRGIDRHFYPDKTIINHPLAHGDLSKTSYKVDLECCLRLWEGYEKLLRISHKINLRIINATDGGYLDVFERCKFESLFS